ncbi:MAG: COQ9 family protein [Alphaproteobacteria bacterium]|nr:COQ9 family protein [Alphaproteobacteria bacterium]
MASPKTDIPDDLRAPLLQAALVHVPFDGWSDRVLALAARDLDLDPGLAELAFPGGVRDMIDLLATTRDREMLARCRKDNLSSLKTGQKITLLIRRRIETGQDIREVVGRTVTFLSLPPNSPLGIKILARTVDLMWKAIDDPSTDFNYYTKRLTLSGVYSSTLLYWLNDESENYQDTWDFLDRRITNVMQFEKAKAKFRNMRAKLPDLWQKLPRLWPSL